MKQRSNDSGNVAQVVILVAGFVMIAIVLIVWLGTAAMNKGADTANCVEFGTGNASYAYEADALDAMCGGDNYGHSAGEAVWFVHDAIGGVDVKSTPGTFSNDSSFAAKYGVPK